MITEDTVSSRGTGTHTEKSVLGGEKRPTPSSDHELAKPSDLFGGAPWCLRTISDRKSSGRLTVEAAGTLEGGDTRYEDLYGDVPPIIGIDAEWDGRYEPHKVLSYQFVVIHKDRASKGIIYTDGIRLKLGEIIGEVLEIGVQNKHLVNWPNEVFLAAHYSKAELSHMEDFPDIKNQFDAAQKTFVSTRAPYSFKYWDRNRNKHQIKAWLYDTGVLAPAGKSVEALGVLYDLKKIKLHEDPALEADLKGRMEDVLRDYPALFEKYAIRDAEISAYHLYWFCALSRRELNQERPPITISGFGAKFVEKLWVRDNISYAEVMGKVSRQRGPKLSHTRKLQFQKSQLVNCDGRDAIEGLAQCCYHGGRNEVYTFGPSARGFWSDFDLVSAYTTAMAAIKIPDYENLRPAISAGDFDLHTLGCARVRFKFPDDTRFPCIPVMADKGRGLVFLLEGKASLCAPEIALARDMGADLEIQHGVIVPWKNDVRPFENFVGETQRRRKGAGEMDDEFWKLVGNSLYGKTCQGISGSTGFNPRQGTNSLIPKHDLTNPLIAGHVTSLTRAVLGEILHRIRPDREILSVTTDGFLTNASKDELDLTGPLCQHFADLREILDSSGDREILVLKKAARRILNVKTRCQLTLESIEGQEFPVTRGGIQIRKPAAEVNEDLITLFRERTPKTKFPVSSPISLRVLYQEEKDLEWKETEKTVNMEPDLKRDLFAVGEYDGIVQCSSRPWPTIMDFEKTRDTLEEFRRERVIKSLEDWEAWVDYLAGVALSKAGVKRSSEGLIGQLKRLVLKAFATGGWGFGGSYTYREFADHLTAAGYPTSVQNVKDAKRAKHGLVEQEAPENFPGVRKFVDCILRFEPDFDAKRMIRQE